MKKRSVQIAIIVFVVIGVMSFLQPATASLVRPTDPSGNSIHTLLYDEESELYWQRYWDQFCSQTYNEQLSAIATLSLSPSNTAWRMAAREDIDLLLLNNTDRSIALAFEPDYRINARYDEPVQGVVDEHYRLLVYQGYTYADAGHNIYPHGDEQVYSFIGAWVCADAVAVPLPATFFFFSSGLMGLMVVRRWKDRG